MSGKQPTEEEEARAAYLVDTTLSELALESQQGASANPWNWLATTIGATDEQEKPPPLPEGTIPTVRSIYCYFIDNFSRLNKF